MRMVVVVVVMVVRLLLCSFVYVVLTYSTGSAALVLTGVSLAVRIFREDRGLERGYIVLRTI